MRFRALIASVLCGLTVTACAAVPALPIEVGVSEGEQVLEGPNETGKYYSFNPHVCPKKLYDAYGPEEWGAFFNLCDALRKGEDSFDCPSEEVYAWCFSGGPLDEFFPVARYCVDMDYLDGYSKGVGRIKYTVPKDEFLAKEKEFEQTIEDILKENVRTDYTDFEKCIALYEYMVNNYVYDYRERDNNTVAKINNLPRGTYGTYRTFKDKKGICNEISNVYNYLLLQCGVDAVKYLGGEEDSKHAWTYVTLDDVGYFIDPTWGLPDTEEHELTYFMMTAQDREHDFGDTMEPEIFCYDHRNPDVDFSATDDRYASLRGGDFEELDTKTKTLYYKVGDERREYHYSS